MSAPFDHSSVPAEGWTPRRVELLRRHVALGLTATESAAALGAVSANAVISKRRRLGVGPARGAPGPIGLPTSAGRQRWRTPPELPVEPLPRMDFPPPPEARPSPLALRPPASCAWPLGPAEAEGDHRTLFCCAPIARFSSYCPTHGALSQRPRASKSSGGARP